MPPTAHRLEARAQLLASSIKGASEGLAQALRGPGDRRPFSERLSNREAVAWWRQHRYDEFGKQALVYFTPDQVMDLDQALSQSIEAEQMAPPMQEPPAEEEEWIA